MLFAKGNVHIITFYADIFHDDIFHDDIFYDDIFYDDIFCDCPLEHVIEYKVNDLKNTTAST